MWQRDGEHCGRGDELLLTGHQPSPSSILSLPHLVLVSIFRHLDTHDLAQLRLCTKEFHHAATEAARSLRPTTLSSHFPPKLESLDLTAVRPEDWSETSFISFSLSTSLTALRLGANCRLTPTGAAHIASVHTNLRSIEVIDSVITDSALLKWSNLKKLTSLSLLGCKELTQAALIGLFAELPCLQEIELGSTNIAVTDDVLAALGNAEKLPRLRKIDLSSCDNFTEVGIAALYSAASSQLETLLLSACWHVDDAMMVTLCSSLPQLQCLSLFEAGEGVSDYGMLQLTKLSHLTSLDLGYSCWGHTNRGLQQFLSTLSSSSTLKMLNIGGAEGVDDAVLRIVSQKLGSLTALDISECQRTTAAGVQQLSQLSALKELSLGWNLKLKSSALAALPRQLTKLDLSYCSALCFTALQPASLSHLEYLELRRCSQLTDAGLTCLVAAAPSLHRLDLSYCLNITSAGLRCLSALTSLSFLTLTGCGRATTVLGFAALAGCPQLTTLEACNNPRVDNGCIQSLSFAGKQLRSLSLRGCPRLCDFSVAALGRISSLEQLEIDGRGVTQAAMTKLHAKLPRLRKVRMMACKDDGDDHHHHVLRR